MEFVTLNIQNFHISWTKRTKEGYWVKLWFLIGRNQYPALTSGHTKDYLWVLSLLGVSVSPDLSLLGGSEIRHTNCAINVILQLWNMIDFRICDIPLFEVLLSICLAIYNFSREFLVLSPSVTTLLQRKLSLTGSYTIFLAAVNFTTCCRVQTFFIQNKFRRSFYQLTTTYHQQE